MQMIDHRKMAPKGVVEEFLRRVELRRRSLEQEEGMWSARPCRDAEDARNFTGMAARARSLRGMLARAAAAFAGKGAGAAGLVFVAEGPVARAEFSMLGVACMLGDYGAARFLVLNGADPDCGVVSHAGGSSLQEPPLATVLAGAYPEEASLRRTPAERKAFCAWLLAHGAHRSPQVPWALYEAAGRLHSSGC